MQLAASVDKLEALRYLGYAGQALDENIEGQLDEAALLCQSVPAAGLWRIFDSVEFAGVGGAGCAEADAPDAAGGEGAAGDAGAAVAADAAGAPGGRVGVALDGAFGQIFLPGEAISEHLRGAKKVALMAVTLGLRNEQAARRQFARSQTAGLLFDACGSSMVESAADALCAALAAEAAADGLVCGSRFSPGYGDLPLDVQPEFLAACGAGKALGITLTPGNLMVPSKSVTAVVGLFEARAGEGGALGEGEAAGAGGPSPHKKARSCEGCKLAGACILRAQGRTCYGG